MSIEAAAQRLERAARDLVAYAPVTDLLGAGDIDSAYHVHVYPGVIHGGFGPRPSTPRHTATSTTGRRADLLRPKRGSGGRATPRYDWLIGRARCKPSARVPRLGR